jgi:hypothetical protein
MMAAPLFSPLTTFHEFSAEEMKFRARSFRDEMVRRRTVRQFSSRPVAREVIDDCLRKAFLLLVVGFPTEGAVVPKISKKALDDIATFL